MKKLSLSTIGLFQALGVAAYVTLISGLFKVMGKMAPKPPAFLGAIAMLSLLVFSVAVVGLVVFGYPAWLALNNKIKKALTILAYTLLYSLLFIIIILFITIV